MAAADPKKPMCPTKTRTKTGKMASAGTVVAYTGGQGKPVNSHSTIIIVIIIIMLLLFWKPSE